MKLKKHSKSLLSSYIIVFLLLTVCIVFPLVNILTKVNFSDFSNFLTNETWKNALINTGIECLCSTFFSVLIGCVFAYAVVRGNIPFKKFFAVIPIIHLITPPFVGGLSFILLFGKQGFFTHTILGLNVDPYGFIGLLIAQTLCFFPLAYLIFSQSLTSINPNTELAAKSLGATNTKIFWTIILPSTISGIISSFLFIAVNVISDFGNPLIVGGRFKVLAVEIYTQLTGWLNVSKSATMGIALIIPSIILFTLHNYYISKTSQKNSSIGGKSLFTLDKRTNAPTIKPKKITTIFLTIFVSVITFIIIAQLVSLILGSFQKLWGQNPQFTLEHITNVQKYGKSLFNSVYYSFISAFLSIFIAAFTSFLVHRTTLPFRKTLNIIIQLPSSIPGSLLGLSLASAAQVLHFRNASVLIIIAMTISFIPFAYKIITQNFSQIKTVIDDSSRSLGVNQFTTFKKLLLPIGKSSLFSGFTYDFIRGTGTLSAVIFLVSFDTPLTSINIVNLAGQCDWGKAASLAFVLTAITFLILGVALVISKKGGKKWNF